MSNSEYKFSKSFELLLGNLVQKINSRQEGEEISKEEAFLIVEAVIAETKEAASQVVEDKAATKRDLKELEARLEAKISECKADILKWMFAMQMTFAGLILAGIKLL